MSQYLHLNNKQMAKCIERLERDNARMRADLDSIKHLIMCDANSHEKLIAIGSIVVPQIHNLLTGQDETALETKGMNDE